MASINEEEEFDEDEEEEKDASFHAQQQGLTNQVVLSVIETEDCFKIDPGDRTHFGRGYGERLWDEIGVNINQIQHDTQHHSYVTSLPRKAIL